MKGYKAFNKDMTNRYGMPFEEGKTYTVHGELVFGNDGNGLHFCKRLEDTLRYFPGMEEEIAIAKVTSIGEKLESMDEFYEYFDLYAARSLRIDKILSREEIISNLLYVNPRRVVRFVSGFRLTEEEKELFRKVYKDTPDVDLAIQYHQERNLDVYSHAYTKVLKREE